MRRVMSLREYKLNEMEESNLPFDLDEWDSIVMEIKPAVERIKDLGYNCKIFMKPYNKILIRVTTDIDSPYTSYL